MRQADAIGSSTEPAREISFGAHTLRIEAPDLWSISLVGDMAEADAKFLIQQLETHIGKDGWVLWLVDVSRLRTILPAARKAANRAPMLVRGLVLIGASFAVRVLTTLTSKAYHLVNPSADSPIVFFQNEEAARDWLDARRSALHRRKERAV